MSITLNGAYNRTDLNNISQPASLDNTQKSAAATTVTTSTPVDIAPLRDSLDISMRAAINTMLASHPLVNTLTNEERAQLVSAVEFSLKQGIGISSLLRIIQNNR